MRMQIRAWLEITHEHLAPLEAEKRIKFVLRVHNSGDIPATIVETRIAITVTNPSSPPLLALQNARAANPHTEQMIVGPDQTIVVEPSSTPINSPEAIDTILSGKQSLFVAGVYTYIDRLGHRDVMNWIYCFEPEGGRLICKGHNE